MSASVHGRLRAIEMAIVAARFNVGQVVLSDSNAHMLYALESFGEASDGLYTLVRDMLAAFPPDPPAPSVAPERTE